MKRRQFYSLLVYLEYSLSAPVRRTFMMKVNNPKKEIQVKDLDIPAGFQWKLTQVAAGTVAATTPTMVSFFLDEACSKEEKN